MVLSFSFIFACWTNENGVSSLKFSTILILIKDLLGGRYTLLSPLIEMLIRSRKTLKATPGREAKEVGLGREAKLHYSYSKAFRTSLVHGSYPH